MVRLGNPFLQLQPGSTVDEDENGLLTGECSYEGDASLSFLYPVGSLHPFDYRLTAYKRRLTRLPTGKCRITLSYIGITADPTPMFIEHPAGSSQEPIETHPDFSKFAGTASAPLNGAVFDESGQFVGFTDPENKLAGVRAYIVPSVMVTLSYYTHYVPNISRVAKVSSLTIPDLIRPPNVRNFLLIGMPYKKIGNLFQVSQQLLGSGPNGWIRQIYS